MTIAYYGKIAKEHLNVLAQEYNEYLYVTSHNGKLNASLKGLSKLGYIFHLYY